MKAEKGNIIQIIHPEDALCGATAIVTQVLPMGVSVVLLTVPKDSKWSPGDAEVFQNGYAIMPKMDHPWDFVERYYYKYHNCNEVALSDDLQKLVDDEYEDGDCAHNVLIRDYNGDREGNLNQIIKDLAVVDCEIYRRSIERFIKIQNNEI